MIATKIAGIDEIGVVRKNGTYCRLLLAKGIWRLQEVEVGGRQCHRECPTSPPPGRFLMGLPLYYKGPELYRLSERIGRYNS